MNTGEYIIVYTSVSLTVASRSSLSRLPRRRSDVTSLTARHYQPLFSCFFFWSPPPLPTRQPLHSRLHRCYLFSDSISALTASVGLLVQIRRRLWRLWYASRHTSMQVIHRGAFFSPPLNLPLRC